MKWIVIFLTGVMAGAVGIALYSGVYSGIYSTHSSMLAALPAAPPATVTALAHPDPAAAPAAIQAPVATTPPPAHHTATVVKSDRAAAALTINPLLIPVAGIRAGQLTDTFDQARGTERRHEALDILAPTGTDVLAVADGRLIKLFNSKPGGLTVYQFDVSEQYAYYYAHLDRYASGVSEGMMLKRGDLIGYVGYTGNANPAAPHLHFAIFALGPEKQWWKGTPINPYPLLGGTQRP